MGLINQKTENLSQELVYDYVFIGMGASNSLILKKLIETKLINDKKVAVIEAENKNENDKTYCFWASPNDSIVNELKVIISHSYNQIEINKASAQNISAQPYYYIRSIDLYQFTKNLIAQNKITIHQAKCNDIAVLMALMPCIQTKDYLIQKKYLTVEHRK